MNTIDRTSRNRTGSEAWSGSWSHSSVDRRSPGYCRVTFDHPPINTITATVAELAEPFVSELATNAIRHSSTDLYLRLSSAGACAGIRFGSADRRCRPGR